MVAEPAVLWGVTPLVALNPSFWCGDHTLRLKGVLGSSFLVLGSMNSLREWPCFKKKIIKINRSPIFIERTHGY